MLHSILYLEFSQLPALLVQDPSHKTNNLLKEKIEKDTIS